MIEVKHIIFEGPPEIESYELEEDGYYLTLYPYSGGFEGQIIGEHLDYGLVDLETDDLKEAVSLLRTRLLEEAITVLPKFRDEYEIVEIFIERDDFVPLDEEEEEDLDGIDFDGDFFIFEAE